MAKKLVSALPPHWLDGDIAKVLRKNNASAIASAIAKNSRFVGAIQNGIAAAEAADPNAMGPSREQYIRQALVEAICENR